MKPYKVKRAHGTSMTAATGWRLGTEPSGMPNRRNFMCSGLRGNEPEMANLQEAYVVVCDYGDIEMKFYSDADEAAEAAKDTWNRLTLSEKRRQHIYSGVIRRKDLNFGQMDDDDLAEGRVDWWCFTGMDTYPGAFDSEKEENKL